MRTAATPKKHEKDDRPDDRNEEGTETAEAVGKEGKHALNIAAAFRRGSIKDAALHDLAGAGYKSTRFATRVMSLP